MKANDLPSAGEGCRAWLCASPTSGQSFGWGGLRSGCAPHTPGWVERFALWDWLCASHVRRILLVEVCRAA
eukprot:scaffold251143_cov30-Tisochrysis_lutea.AAC.1